MFRYQNPVGGEKLSRGLSKLEQNGEIVDVVWRIEVNNIPRRSVSAANKGLGGQANYIRDRFGDLKMIEVVLDKCAGPAAFIDKRGMAGPARDRFDPDGSGSRAKIEKTNGFIDAW